MADTEYYEVNPSDTTQIWRTDTLGQLYRAGGVNVHTRFAGVLAALGTEPPVQSHIYHRTMATNDPAEPMEYYQRAANSPTTVFQGVVNDPAARVVETNVWERIPIGDLYVRKEQERDNHRREVRLSACAISSQPNWALILSTIAREDMTDANETLQDRLKDIAIDGDPKAYWPPGRSITIGIRHRTLGSEQFRQVSDDAEWGALMKDKGEFQLAISEATYAVQEAIDAAYDVNGRTEEQRWNDLAAIDVTDQAYGWPDYWP